jgi:hypothetical protein
MSSRKRWGTVPPRGRLVDHPAVIAEAADKDRSRTPRRVVRDGLSIVTYCRPRVYLDRDAWEMLPADGVLLMRVEPTNRSGFTLALTAQELEPVFGEVRATGSWRDARYYHFPEPPPAIRAFRVDHTRAPTSTASDAAQTVQQLRAPAIPSRIPMPAIRTSREPLTEATFSDWARAWYAKLGAPAESAAYLGAVTAWRNAWRPHRVRALLVAESHVGEHPGDQRISVLSQRWIRNELPSRYVRLIYCLGYGESGICSSRPDTNGGTPQFWNIFGQIAFGQSPPQKAGSTVRDRLRWKVAVLEELQRRGIWLQDASPLGIYLGRGKRTDPRHQVQLLREGYSRVVWPSVADDPPGQVWVIGKGVAAALAGLPGITPTHVISQPQDRNREQHLDGLSRLTDIGKEGSTLRAISKTVNMPESATTRPATAGLTDDPPVLPAVRQGLDLRPACQQCGGMMQRTGSCYTCSSCGFNTGCG